MEPTETERPQKTDRAIAAASKHADLSIENIDGNAPQAASAEQADKDAEAEAQCSPAEEGGQG